MVRIFHMTALKNTIIEFIPNFARTHNSRTKSCRQNIGITPPKIPNLFEIWFGGPSGGFCFAKSGIIRSLNIPLCRLCLLAVLVVGWFPSSARGQDITTGLVGHWKLDEGSGTTASDSSGNGNTGTLTNGPTWTTGQLNSAVNFDGSDDYIDAGGAASLDIDGPVSLCAWFNVASIPGDIAIVANDIAINDSQYKLELQSGGVILFGWSNGAGNDEIYTTAALVSTGIWYHACGVRISDSSVKIYLNGIERSVTPSGNFSIPADAGNTAIGRLGQRGVDYFPGIIDDARIYNRALSAADVAALYSLTCSNPTGVAGKIVYNSDYNVMQYCNGTRWKAMGPFPGAGGAGCSNPARVTGSLLYNTTFNVMQYCDGTNWKAMGPFPGAGGGGCSNPADSTGSMVFNVDAAVVQYCDGANWVRMGS